MTSFYQCARRSMPPAAALAATTAFVSMSFSKTNDDIKEIDEDYKFGLPNGMMQHQSSSGLFKKHQYNSLFYSPAFSLFSKHSRSTVALCESPQQKQLHQKSNNNIPYKPVDPTEPVTDPNVEIKSSDGKKIVKAGMWGGEEEDGLVRNKYAFHLYLSNLMYNSHT